jgi:hypothetical protein
LVLEKVYEQECDPRAAPCNFSFQFAAVSSRVWEVPSIDLTGAALLEFFGLVAKDRYVIGDKLTHIKTTTAGLVPECDCYVCWNSNGERYELRERRKHRRSRVPQRAVIWTRM